MIAALRFNINDIVYFINKHHVCSGEVHGITTTLDIYGTHTKYKILHTSGDMGAYFDIDEEDVYKSASELKNKMFKGI